MFLIFEHHYDAAYGMMVMNEDGLNMMFETEKEARSWAENNCIHEWIIVEV